MDRRSDKKKNGNSKKYKSPSNEAKSCCICLNELSNRALTDTCRHEFCFDCIRVWSEEHNRCPICRQVYQNVVHQIVSDQQYEQLPVAEQPDPEDTEMDALLQRMLLYLRIIGLRNRVQRQRDGIDQDLQESLKVSQSTRDRSIRADIRRRQKEIRDLDLEINRLNTVLSMDSPTEEDLLGAVHNLEDISDIEIIEVIQEIGDMDENQELVPAVNTNEESDPSSDGTSNDSGNESDDEESQDSGDRESGPRTRKRRADSDSAEGYPQRKRRN